MKRAFDGAFVTLPNTSCKDESKPKRVNVLFVCDEWKSSEGGLSTFNREFAINVAKTSSEKISVHCYVSQSSEPDREDARNNGVNLITAQSVPETSDRLECLRFPPPELSQPDFVVGHGRKFGFPSYFIARTTNCNWLQFVHVYYEDLGKYKQTDGTSDTIEENEKKHKEEIELCKAANAVVAVGSRLQKKYSKCLPETEVHVITPGILDKFTSLSDKKLGKVTHSPDEFSIFVFGGGSYENLALKGYDIIADAVGSLGEKFNMTFVGSPEGKYRNIEEWFLQKTRIRRKQVTVRGYCDQGELKIMLNEADLVAMPSCTEGFGLIALEAISACVPVLVTGESGIAEALKKAAHLRENYRKTFSWNTQCEKFKKLILSMMEKTTGSCPSNYNKGGSPLVSDDREQITTAKVRDESTGGIPVVSDERVQIVAAKVRDESTGGVPVVSDEKEQIIAAEATHRPESKGAEAADPLYDNLPLEQIPWYFGKVTIGSAKILLQRHDPGTFLVRDSGTAQKLGSYSILRILRGRSRDSYRHQEIETLPNGKLVLKGHEEKHFPNLAASVQYFAKCLESSIPLVPLVEEKGCSVSSIHQKPVPADSKDSDHASAKAVNSISDKIEILHSATKNGNIELIELMLSFGLDIDSRDSKGNTPLMVAAKNDKPDAFQLFIEHDADPSLRTNNGLSLLHFAAQGGNTSIINKLLSLGLDIDSRNSYDSTPLMVAAYNHKQAAFQHLIQHGADPSLKNNLGWSLLHLAAQAGNTSIINKLVSLGLDIDSRSGSGFTPLMAAAKNDKPAAFQLLVQHGTDPLLKDNLGWSLLHCAAQGGNTSITNKLLSFGLDIDSRNSKGSTPLMVAAAYDKPTAFQLFIQHGANPSLKTNNGWSLLHCAAQGGNTSIINKLLLPGLDINSRSSYGTTPLMVAGFNNKPDAFQLLVQHGADPSLKDNTGWSLLHYAAQGGSTFIIEKLLSFGLDIDSRTSKGVTPLMFAAIYDKPVAFQLLIEHDSNSSLRSNNGWSLLHFAACSGNTSIITKLLSLGLGIDSRNSKGKTPPMMATERDKHEAVKYLISKGALKLP